MSNNNSQLKNDIDECIDLNNILNGNPNLSNSCINNSCINNSCINNSCINNNSCCSHSQKSISNPNLSQHLNLNYCFKQSLSNSNITKSNISNNSNLINDILSPSKNSNCFLSNNDCIQSNNHKRTRPLIKKDYCINEIDNIDQDKDYENNNIMINLSKKYEEESPIKQKNNSDKNQNLLSIPENEEKIEIIVSDLDCFEDMNDDNQNEQDNNDSIVIKKTNENENIPEEPQEKNKYSTIFEITKSVSSKNSFIKLNNKLHLKLISDFEHNRQTNSYLMALYGGMDQISDGNLRPNYEVDSIIPEESSVYDEESNISINKSTKLNKYSTPTKYVINFQVRHRSSKSELMNINEILKNIEKKGRTHNESSHSILHLLKKTSSGNMSYIILSFFDGIC